MLTFAISFLCSPSKRRKNGESPIEVSFFRIHIKGRVPKKNNPLVGPRPAFRDENKRLSQTDCTGSGYQKTITTLTARHTYAKMMDETVFSSNCQINTPQGEKIPHKYKPPVQ